MPVEPLRPFGEGALAEIGRLDDVCPACLATLARRPGRKTRCPHCGAFIFVSTRALDRQRVLVTEAQATIIEQEWTRRQNTRLAVLVDKSELERLRPILARQFGREPTDREVIWAYLKQDLLDNRRAHHWGLYRNTRLSMAALLERENQAEAALLGYLEVCYLDANGPMNRGTITHANGSREVGAGPDFSPERECPTRPPCLPQQSPRP